MTTDPTTPITTDLLCVGCQYNLRTRTASDACPECGLPIAQTLTHRKEHAGAVVDARLLRIACYCIAVPSLLCPLFMAGMFVLSRFEKMAPRGVVVAEILLRDLGQIVFVATLIVGVFLFLNAV